MKTIALSLSLIFFASCTAVDVVVDKTQAKFENDTTIVVPSKAVRPVPNQEYIEQKTQEVLERVNDSLRKGTK